MNEFINESCYIPQYPGLSIAGFIINCFLLPTICVVGVTLNMVSICIFAGVGRPNYQATTVQVYLSALCYFDIAQLSLSTFILSLQAVEVWLVNVMKDNLVLEEKRLIVEKILIHTMPVLFPLLMSANYASVWTMVGITIQRFRAIVYPIHCRDITDVRRARLGVLAIAVLSCLLNIPNFSRYAWVTDPDGSLQLDDIKDKEGYEIKIAKTLVHVIGMYLFPLIIICSLNSVMIYHIRKAQISELRPHYFAQKLEQRAIIMVSAVVALFFLCHSFAIYNFIGELANKNLYDESEIAWLVNDLNNLMINLNSCLNPFVYLIFTARFRNLFWEKINTIRSKRKSSSATFGRRSISQVLQGFQEWNRRSDSRYWKGSDKRALSV